jgi:hypothetical protein
LTTDDLPRRHFRDANAQRIKMSMTVALLQQPGADHEQALHF